MIAYAPRESGAFDIMISSMRSYERSRIVLRHSSHPVALDTLPQSVITSSLFLGHGKQQEAQSQFWKHRQEFEKLKFIVTVGMASLQKLKCNKTVKYWHALGAKDLTNTPDSF